MNIPPPPDIGGIKNDGHWSDFIVVPLLILGCIFSAVVCIWVLLGVVR